MKEPKASFVIPAHNSQKYLSAALDSCLRQTIKEVEVIVVNDGSTDGTEELLDWYAKQDDRVRPFHLKENGGPSAARNLGNSKVDSPYIFVLDSDDKAFKSRVRDSLYVFHNRKPDIVYGPFFAIDEWGQMVGKVPAGPFNKELAIRRKFNFIGHSTMAYRTGVTKNVQYDTGEYSKLGLDDWKFQWDCVRKGYKFDVVKNFLSQWRNNGTGLSANRDPKQVEELKGKFLATI